MLFGIWYNIQKVRKVRRVETCDPLRLLLGERGCARGTPWPVSHGLARARHRPQRRRFLHRDVSLAASVTLAATRLSRERRLYLPSRSIPSSYRPVGTSALCVFRLQR